MYSLCGNIKSDYYLKVRDSQVRLYHASPIPTETRQKNSFGWAATGLLMSSPVHFHRAMLVCTEYLFFVLNLILSLILLTYVLTNPIFDLLQKGKDLNRTLGSCTWEILTSYLGWRSLCTQMNSSERPTWYLAATLCTFPGSRLARLCWWIAPLLSYIDVRHTNFLPPSLRVGEARDLGPKYTTAEDLTFMRDDSAEHVSQSHRAHTCWKAWGLGASSRASIAESVNSLDVEVSQGEKMVKRKAMTIDQFFSRRLSRGSVPSLGQGSYSSSSSRWPYQKETTGRRSAAPGSERRSLEDPSPGVGRDHDSGVGWWSLANYLGWDPCGILIPT